MSRIVAALGGNALGNDPVTQQKHVDLAADIISSMVLMGHEILVAHGNGPQVGMINLAFEKGYETGLTPLMPLAECTAMSQGYIGYHLQQAIDAKLMEKGSLKPVITMLTQVIVDENDPAFSDPTKPIGSFYTKEVYEKLRDETGDIYKQFSEGYRRVVASPKPQKIYETVTLDVLLKAGQVIIACGGGGIPIIKTSDGYRGVSAVIDKDLAAAKLAHLVNADYLFIMTQAPYTALNYGKENQVDLKELTVKDAQKYIDQGHFPAGSMLPKIQAAIDFVKGYPARKAVICSLGNALEALNGGKGTVIFDD